MQACEGARFPNAGAQNGQMSIRGGSGSDLFFTVFVAMCMDVCVFHMDRCYMCSLFLSFMAICMGCFISQTGRHELMYALVVGFSFFSIPL